MIFDGNGGKQAENVLGKSLLMDRYPKINSALPAPTKIPAIALVLAPNQRKLPNGIDGYRKNLLWFKVIFNKTPETLNFGGM